MTIGVSVKTGGQRVVKAPSRSTGVLALACGQKKGALTREARGAGERGPSGSLQGTGRVALRGGEVRSSVEASNNRRAKGPWFQSEKKDLRNTLMRVGPL
jgi:hypothetical protein